MANTLASYSIHTLVISHNNSFVLKYVAKAAYVAIKCTQCFNYLITGPPALTVNITKNTESSSVAVLWDKVDNSLPTSYIVTWTSERDLNNVQVKTLIEQSSYTITGLTLDTVYTITVTAINRCGQGSEYSTSVSLTKNATSTISSLSSTSANPMAVTSTAGSNSTSTATVIMIANSNTATIISSPATISSSTAYITLHSTTITTLVMNSFTTNPITIAVSIIADTTSSFTEISDLKSTTGSTNPSTSTTTIVTSSTSTAKNPADATTADDTSKLLQKDLVYLYPRLSRLISGNF